MIHYFVHGRARGHATRSLPIVDKLRGAGFRVLVHAGNDAQALFHDDPEMQPAESVLPGMGLATLTVLRRSTARALQAFAEAPPSLVVSDGDQPGLLAARKLGVPSIAVGHGVVFSHCERPRGVPFVPWHRERLKAGFATFSSLRQVAVNFVPVLPRSSSTVVARPSLRAELQRAWTPRDRVVCYFSEQDDEKVLRSLVRLGERPILFSNARCEVSGVELRPRDAAQFADALLHARAVVCSAGSQTISECLALGVPVFALALPRHPEQSLNVALLRAARAGWGGVLHQVEEQELVRFLAEERGGAAPDLPEATDAVLVQCREMLELAANEVRAHQ